MKQFIKNFVLRVWAVARPSAEGKVVFYHDVGLRYTDMGTPAEMFWRHMRHLRPEDRLCFDDGFRGIWDVRNEFVSRGIKPIVFIAVELIGQKEYLSWPEILELQRLGFRFESHTWSHRELTLVNDLKHELEDSRAFLSEKLGKEVTELCLPCGLFSDRVIEAAKAAGYRKIYTSIPGDFDDPVLVPRCLVQDLDEKGFVAVLNGGMKCLAARYRAQHYQR